MSESDDISARLSALETVVSQLITHLAVRAEDPAGWVRTRKVLALSLVSERADPFSGQTGRIRDALAGFFDQAETVATDYSDRTRRGTPGPFVR
ncbi:hypothetical protein [Rhodopila sp.]|uniref:hypothetical protein n=1 Tax=Rhodopila sp. TaxID=2480087 RepID=UPI003D10D5F3